MRRMPESHLLLMCITPDLGTFAPLFMHMRINAKIFCFLDFLAIYQLKKFYKLHNLTKLDKGYRLVYKLSYLVGKKNSTFFFGEVSENMFGNFTHVPYFQNFKTSRLQNFKFWIFFFFSELMQRFEFY
jgi:hypothetical protein